jgi:hypothetical protein
MVTEHWDEIEGVAAPIAEMVVADVGLIDEFAHPLRMRLLMLLREPATVAELAARLEYRPPASTTTSHTSSRSASSRWWPPAECDP